MTSRQIGSILEQGADESIAYQITTTAWGSDPSSVEVKAYDVSGGSRTDVTENILSGSASVSGDVITTPKVQGLTASKDYRIEIKFTSGGNVYEPYLLISAKY